jgi:alpha-mannosidase
MRTAHVIPSFHYDVAYLDTFAGYLPKALDNLLAMLELLRTQPGYTFVVEQVILLESLLTRHSDLLPELRALAQQGRLEIACGMYVMPDVNMPSGESLLRQAITGQRWLQSRLGVTATTCWIADCWGHPNSLPGLLRHCGYTRYIFWRGKQPWLVSSEFQWRGLDGSRLLCHWTPFGYGAVRFLEQQPVANAPDHMLVPEADIHRLVEAAAGFAATPAVFLGNGGDLARPQRSTVPAITALNQQGDDTRYVCSTPGRFFDQVEAAAAAGTLPEYDGEFNPVFQGTYSSRIALKQLNRRLESALGAAEKANVLLWLDGGDYPAAQLAEAWRITLVNQFHDIISGTVVDAAYEQAVAQYRTADSLVTRLLMDAVDRATARRSGHHGGMSVLVFNAVPRPRTEVLRLNTLAIGWSGYRVVDAEGRELPVQLAERELLFQAELPPLGYAVFGLRTADAGAPRPLAQHGSGLVAASKPAPAATRAAPHRIETDDFHVTVQGGVITSLLDKGTGRDYVDPARPFWNDLVLQPDNGDLWLLYEGPLNGNVRTTTPLADPYPGPVTAEDRVNRAGVSSHATGVTSEITEQGPLRTVVRARGALRFWQIRVEFTQQISIYHHLRRIDFRTELTGHGQRYRVRVAFPTPIRPGKITHAVPHGQLERPEGEYPIQGWFAYGDAEATVYLCNRGLPGANVTDGVLLLSLMRSVAMEYKGASTQAYEDGVHHSFSYSVLPADGAHPVEPWWEAEALNSPPLTIAAADVRPGREPRLRLEPGNVVLSALYRDGDVLTARLYEAAGTNCRARLWMAGLRGCLETDALQLNGSALPILDDSVQLEFSPFQIKTLRLDVARTATRSGGGLPRRLP